MASYSIVVVFFLSLCVLSSPASAHWKKHHSYQATVRNTLAFETCKKTPFQTLCLKTFASSLKTNACKDVQGLATIAVSGALKKMLTASALFERRIKLSNNPFLKPITGCSKSYVSVSKKVEAALNALKKPKCSSAEVIMSLGVAMAEADVCQKGLSMQFMERKSFGLKNMEFMHMCSNAIAIAKLLPAKF